MRSLLWLLIGAVLMYVVIVKGRSILNKLTPQGIAQQVEKKGHETATSFGDFYATFKASMAAREEELRHELNVPA